MIRFDEWDVIAILTLTLAFGGILILLATIPTIERAYQRIYLYFARKITRRRSAKMMGWKSDWKRIAKGRA